MGDNERIKLEIEIKETDYISLGFHSFFYKRGMTRNLIIGAFLILLVIQSIREIVKDEGEYLYIILLLILIFFPPINIFTSYKGYFKKNWSENNAAIYTIDKRYVRLKRGKFNEKKEISKLTKITENKKAIYLWWADSFETTIIPKRYLNDEQMILIRSLIV